MDEVLSVDRGYQTDKEAEERTPRLPGTRVWIYSQKVTRDALRICLGRCITLGEQEARMEVLVKHIDCVAADDMNIEKCKRIQHRIETGDAVRISQLPFKSAFKQGELNQEQVDRMTNQRIIEE